MTTCCGHAVYVEDCDEPDSGFDQFWIDAKDKSRDIVPTISMDREATDNAVEIQRGNIVAPCAGGGNRDK